MLKILIAMWKAKFHKIEVGSAWCVAADVGVGHCIHIAEVHADYVTYVHVGNPVTFPMCKTFLWENYVEVSND